jgi:DNA polymerase III alpha subunit (gram-positive type)
MKFLVADSESGGPGIEYSLLTVCLKVYEGSSPSTATLIDSLNLMIKHKDYHISAQGMQVNKIDLVKLEKEGISLKDSTQLFYKFLKKHSPSEKAELILVGHGVSGDVRLFVHNLISEQNWNKMVIRLHMDTLSFASTLRGMGAFNASQPLKLKSLCDYAGLGPFNYHDAEGDVDATWELLRWFGTVISIDKLLILKSTKSSEDETFED